MGEGRPHQIAKRASWTAWGDRLLAVLALTLAIGLAGAWIMQYDNPDGNGTLVERLSYPILDPTWMPPGVTHPYPIIGVHYFGDMWYHVGFGEAQSPYIIAGRPAQYLPVAIYFFKAWGLFGYPIALGIMTLLNIVLISSFAWKLLTPTARSRRILVVSLTIVMTAPMLVTLDRGGHQYVALGLLAWALWLYKRNRTVWAVLLTVAAISLKTYFVFFLLYPFLRGHKRFAIEAASLTALINGILFLSFPGKATVSFGGFLTSSLQFGNANAFENIFNGTSLTSAIFHVSKLLFGTEPATQLFFDYERILFLPGILWLGLVGCVAASRRVPAWAAITLTLSTAAMAIPAAWPYNYASASLAALYFGTRGNDPFPIANRKLLDRLPLLGKSTKSSKGSRTALRCAIGASIVAALAPQFFVISGVGGASVTAYYLLAPAVTLVSGVFTLVWLVLGRSTVHPPTSRSIAS